MIKKWLREFILYVIEEREKNRGGSVGAADAVVSYDRTEIGDKYWPDPKPTKIYGSEIRHTFNQYNKDIVKLHDSYSVMSNKLQCLEEWLGVEYHEKTQWEAKPHYKPRRWWMKGMSDIKIHRD